MGPPSGVSRERCILAPFFRQGDSEPTALTTRFISLHRIARISTPLLHISDEFVTRYPPAILPRKIFCIRPRTRQKRT
jgi:hypothetical protein